MKDYGKDFVNVRLTASGQRFANGNEVRIANQHSYLIFRPGESLRVTLSYEWRRLLARETHEGLPMFELEPETEQGESNGIVSVAEESTS